MKAVAEIRAFWDPQSACPKITQVLAHVVTMVV